MLAAFIDVPRRTFANDARDAAHFRAKRKVSAPGRRIDSRALFHDDDVARTSSFNRGRAEMPGPDRLPAVDAEFDRQHAAGDFALRGVLVDARDDAAQAKSVHGVRNGATIELV